MTFPEWQGGINPPYYAGSHILDLIAPKGNNLECAEVPVKTNFEEETPVTDGIAWKNELIEQQKMAYEICKMKDPDKIIILGETAPWNRRRLIIFMESIRKIRQ